MKRKKDPQKNRTKRQHRDSRQNESRGTHPQPAPAAPSGDNTHVFFSSYPLISHQAYTLSQTLGSELPKLCSPASGSLVCRLQLLMKTQQSEHTLNTFPPKLILIPSWAKSTQLRKPQQSLSPRRQLGLKHRNATVCSSQWHWLYTCKLQNVHASNGCKAEPEQWQELCSICSHVSHCKH